MVLCQKPLQSFYYHYNVLEVFQYFSLYPSLIRGYFVNHVYYENVHIFLYFFQLHDQVYTQIQPNPADQPTPADYGRKLGV
ncbi:hypothetical protein PEC301653_41560 [Pectobacterium carotovorum subsp. carotovorum]|nr:hypothetical protein PEC301653_41560 [Pectobacterium carotovorum subsp. carotovorum]